MAKTGFGSTAGSDFREWPISKMPMVARSLGKVAVLTKANPRVGMPLQKYTPNACELAGDYRMCFSAEASFGLSAALLPAGVYCVKIALSKNRLMLSVAVVPLLFGVQQFSEGWVWLGLAWDDAEMVRIAGLVFLGFALFFWPFWIPFCSFCTESGGRRKAFGFLSVMGLVAGLVVFVPLTLIEDSPVAEVMHHSIHYGVARSPAFQFVPVLLWELIYVAIVSSPLFSSPNMKMLFLGIALVLSAAISYVVFWYAFASVWCFFAAILSVYLCFFFRNLPSAAQPSV